MLQGRTSDRARNAPPGRLAALLAVAILGLAATPACAAPVQSKVSADGRTLSLAPGERVTVRLEAEGRLTLVSAVPTPAEAARPPKPGGEIPEGPAPGTVAFLLGVIGAESILKIESGLSQALNYRAVLSRESAAVGEPAHVCTVLPLLASWEQWPYAVRSLTLSGFSIKATNEVVCEGPASQQETTL